MGLDTTHNCWHGPYSQFMRWRRWIAKQIGIPLDLMDGFLEWVLDAEDVKRAESLGYDNQAMAIRNVVDSLIGMLPLKWSILRGDPLEKLLHHSDCEGEIAHADCLPIANRLQEILDANPTDIENIYTETNRGCYDGMVAATKRFIAGLKLAHEAGENVQFG